jgi:integrase
MRWEEIDFENRLWVCPAERMKTGVPTSVAREPSFTTGLPKGTAQRFLEFADEAAKNDLPLNTLLTLRWHALRAEGADYPYMSLPPPVPIA